MDKNNSIFLNAANSSFPLNLFIFVEFKLISGLIGTPSSKHNFFNFSYVNLVLEKYQFYYKLLINLLSNVKVILTS